MSRDGHGAGDGQGAGDHYGAGDLVVSGGGSVRVVGDALLREVFALDDAARTLDEAVRRLRSIDRALPFSVLADADAPLSAGRAESAIDDAVTLLTVAVDDAEKLAFAVRVCIDAYGVAEHAVSSLAGLLAARAGLGMGYLGGALGSLALGLAGPTLIGGGLGLVVGAALRPATFRRAGGALGDRLADHRAVLSSPILVSLTRLGVMSADDFEAGLLRMPAPLVSLLGDEGLGILGLDTSAGLVAGAAAGAGLLRETPVRVTAVASTTTAPASDFADRASRIPTTVHPPTAVHPPAATPFPSGAPRPGIGQQPDQVPQIRVDRYSEPGRPDRFEVYLGGTLDFAPRATDEPWDLTSNVGGIAGSDAAGSYRAVEQALAASGATAQSDVVVTGYSQGGLVAAMLAASDDHHVTGLYTLGAPAAQVPVPADVPWVAVEHSDDIVPALGGTWDSTAPVVVRREVFGDGPPPGELFFPAHELARYRDSAALLDAAADPRIARVGDALAPEENAAVRSTWYHAERTP